MKLGRFCHNLLAAPERLKRTSEPAGPAAAVFTLDEISGDGMFDAL